MISKIKGVNLINLISNEDKRGFFREVTRLDKSYKFNKNIKQISHSHVRKNIFKGWHGHQSQLQINYVIKGKLLVFLYDDRVKSKTYDHLEVYKLDSSNPIIYSFEPGILHGYYTSRNEIEIMYFTSENYNSKKEIRKNYDYNNLNKRLINKGYKIKFKKDK